MRDFGNQYTRLILRKIKKNGHLVLITEFTDELFSPVIYKEYMKLERVDY